MILPMFQEVVHGFAACILTVAVLALVGCGGGDTGGTADKAPTNNTLLEALSGHAEPIVLGAPEGPQMVIVPELGARVLGAAIGGADDENLMWVNKTILDGSYWNTEPRAWNAGGLRSWIAPEDLFFVNAAKDPASWFVPAVLDPGTFRIERTGTSEAVLAADIDLPANNGETYTVTLTRELALLTEPPAAAGPLTNGTEYMGIVQTHSLTNRGQKTIGTDLPYVTLWSLLQIEPSGTTLVPLKAGADSAGAYREYFNPIGDRMAVQGGIVSIKIDGKYRLKLGVRPEAAGNGIAFLRDNGDGTGVLFAKLFAVDPEGTYVDKPWGTDSPYGDAIELYNDDGAMGGFAEIEAHGPAKTIAPGESQTHTINLHIFRGKLDDLKGIASRLYGADFAAAMYF